MNIAIIGVGLIGGSIGMAIKSKAESYKSKVKIIAIGRNIKHLKLAKKLGAVDEITTDIKKGVKNADIIFICIPVGLIADTVKNILPYCKRGVIITDVGSVKEEIVNEVEKFLSTPYSVRAIHELPLLPTPCFFVGGHPIAGSEKISVKHASQDLYKDAIVILTPTRKTDKKALKTVKHLWHIMGAKVEIMSAKKHDQVVSYTSHLPHIVAFALVKIINHLKFAGNSFQDMTRIVSSNPAMWSDIFFENRKNILKAVKEFCKELSKIEKTNSKEKLSKIFEEAKIKRDKLCNQLKAK